MVKSPTMVILLRIFIFYLIVHQHVSFRFIFTWLGVGRARSRICQLLIEDNTNRVLPSVLYNF